MYRTRKWSKQILQINKDMEAESLEKKLRRMKSNKEPIAKGEIAMVYTDRKDGVRPELDIRTDKWEIASETGKIISMGMNAKWKKEDDENGEESKANEEGQTNSNGNDKSGDEGQA